MGFSSNHFNRDIFAANLRGARAELGMSQKELAKAAGVSEDAIFTYESGKGYIPGGEAIIAICMAVKRSPNEMLGWADDKTNVSSTAITNA